MVACCKYLDDGVDKNITEKDSIFISRKKISFPIRKYLSAVHGRRDKMKSTCHRVNSGRIQGKVLYHGLGWSFLLKDWASSNGHIQGSRCSCCCSVSQASPTLCDPTDCSTPGFPVLHYLPEFAQTHVHWVSDAIQPSHPLSPVSPPALSLSQHQGLFQWVSSSSQVVEVSELQLLHQSFQWVFRVGFL